MKISKAYLPESDIYRLSYTALANRPRKELERISEWLGIPGTYDTENIGCRSSIDA